MYEKQCFKCMAIYMPVKGNGAIHCPMCEVAHRDAVGAAEKYQNAIRSGDANVRPLNEADALKNRQAIRKRYGHNPGNADTRMVTHRDVKK